MEIGSIFEIDPKNLFAGQASENKLPLFKGTEYADVSYFNTGRSAIEYLLKGLRLRGSKKIWIPSFVCMSVVDAASRAGMQIEFYSVGNSMSVYAEEISTLPLQRGDIFYVVQYFGIMAEETTRMAFDEIRSEGIELVEDVTMSLLSSKNAAFGFGDYIVGSLRKWFPIPDGAFLVSKNDSLPRLGKESAMNEYMFQYFVAQVMKHCYLENEQLFDKGRYLTLVQKSMGSLFSDYEIREMSDIARDLMLGLDIDSIRQRRISNHKAIEFGLSAVDGISVLSSVDNGMVPLGAFLLADNRDGLYQHLVKNDIYPNIHWRENAAMEGDASARELSAQCITIPCDQRYESLHMEHIAAVVHDFYRGE